MTAAWDASPLGIWIRALPYIVAQPRFRAVIYFRISSWLWEREARSVALFLQGRAIRTTGAEIHPAALIGPGLCLAHSVGIVVGHEVRTGDDLLLFHGVTLGHSGRGGGQPTLGDRVKVGAGAKLLGPITVGDDAWIGANAVVLGDVAAGATVGGVVKLA